ncbi:MAG: mechanosensitive ion channel family protein [Proteobacteria bacterium]|nr:mechanosensitive ion channel family protein [Pseudomonadota bacterium]MBU4327313.1 mechanosensitive ion channel family protein [Pseudomonadota bacterium]MBU4394325.1 mechanosensitive ion channel family protein [Pseudomonadota bacterium]
MNIIIIHAIPLTLLGEIDYDNKSALTSFSDMEELLREVELKEGNMEFRMEQFVGLGTTMAGVILVFLLGFVVFFLSRRGLKTLLHLEYISDPVYVVTMNIIRWLLIIAVVIISLQSMGVKVGNIMAGMLTVAGMIAIGFIAVWSVMSNILCSGFLVAFNVFEIGDEVEVVEPVGGSGLKGKVVSFNVMFTTLEEEVGEGETVFTQIPNNIFFQKSLRRRKGIETEGLGQHLLSKPVFHFP